MSFRWIWPKLRQQPYSTLQQEESEAITLEKAITPPKLSRQLPWFLSSFVVLINIALLWVAVQIYLRESVRVNTHHDEKLIRSPFPESS